MEAKDSSSTPLPESSKQRHYLHQKPSNSQESPSQSSQAYTSALSGTGASTQSATVTTEGFDQIAYEATINHQLAFAFFFSFLFYFAFLKQKYTLLSSSADLQFSHSSSTQTLSAVPDRTAQDLRLVGSWAAANPDPDTFAIEHDPILSPIAINTANRENQNTEAVGVLRASLHREVPEDQSEST